MVRCDPATPLMPSASRTHRRFAASLRRMADRVPRPGRKEVEPVETERPTIARIGAALRAILPGLDFPGTENLTTCVSQLVRGCACVGFSSPGRGILVDVLAKSKKMQAISESRMSHMNHLGLLEATEAGWRRVRLRARG